MRKILFLILGGVFLFTSSAYAAMTCTTVHEDELPQNTSGKPFNIELHLNCEFDTTPGTAVYTFTADQMNFLNGAYGYTIIIAPGDTLDALATAPDAASVQLQDTRELTLIDPAVKGLNLVQATTTTQEHFDGPNGDLYQIINERYRWVLTITDQATNNASIDVWVQGSTK